MTIIQRWQVWLYFSDSMKNVHFWLSIQKICTCYCDNTKNVHLLLWQYEKWALVTVTIQKMCTCYCDNTKNFHLLLWQNERCTVISMTVWKMCIFDCTYKKYALVTVIIRKMCTCYCNNTKMCTCYCDNMKNVYLLLACNVLSKNQNPSYKGHLYIVVILSITPRWPL